jgi:hypothetical protein
MLVGLAIMYVSFRWVWAPVATRLRIDPGQSTVGEGKGGERKRHDALLS